MPITVTVNGITYSYPTTDDVNWGADATNWASAVSANTLQKSGGTFTLSRDVNFGPSFGIKTLHVSGRSSNTAQTGVVRLANTDTVAWRNAANTGNLALGLSSTDRLTFNGNPVTFTNTHPILIDTAAGVISHANSALIVATYGNAYHIPQVTVDTFGHITAITTIPVDNASFAHANGAFVTTNSSYIHANSAYNQANIATTNADAAFIKANSAGLRANTLVTDNVPETTTNLYFTSARVRANISNTTPINYNSTTGVISHALSGAVATTYGNATSIPQFTLDSTGHITSASNVSIQVLPPSTANGQLLIGNTVSGSFDVNTLTQGSGITITNNKGSITIASNNGSMVVDGGVVLLDSKVASGNANIEFTSFINNTYDEYYVQITDFKPSDNNVALRMRVSENGGTVWASAQNTYSHTFVGSGSITPVPTASGSSNANNIQMLTGITNTTISSHQVRVFTPASTAGYKTLNYSSQARTQDGDWWSVNGMGVYRASANAINAVQFILSSGTFANGTFRLYGVSKTPPSITPVQQSIWDTANGAFAKANNTFNPIINGSMDIWQRGTTFASIPSGGYAADRWKREGTSGAAMTFQRTTSTPTVAEAGILFNYALEVDVTTADATVAAGDLETIAHRIEGFNWRPFAQREFTLSFWVNATKTGTHCVSFRNSGDDRSYVATYTISTTNTWEYKTITVPASPSAGIWDYTSGTGLTIAFTMMAGSNFHTTAGSWQTGFFSATSDQVNDMDSTANFFRITGVKLQLGSSATPINPTSFSDELVRCQRYYQKSFQYATTPAQNSGSFAGALGAYQAVAASTTMSMTVRFPVILRATPTLTLYNPANTNAQARNQTTSTDSTGAGTNNIGESGGQVSYNTSTGTGIGQSWSVHWTAEAEL